MSECVLQICDGSGWIQVADFTPNDTEICPCSYGATPVEPPPDLHDRIMDAIREELQARRRPA